MSVPSPTPEDLRVAERMTRDVVTIDAGKSCRFALQMMGAARIDRLPVLDGDRLVGLVTEADIRRRAPRRVEPTEDCVEDTLLNAVNVAGIMTYAPVTISSASSLAEAARTMLAAEVSALPVVDGGRLVGILTFRDLLRVFSEMLGITARKAANGTDG